MKLMGKMDIDNWYDVYRRLVFFDLELQKSEDQSMQDVLNMQFEDANRQFGKFVESDTRIGLLVEMMVILEGCRCCRIGCCRRCCRRLLKVLGEGRFIW